MYSETIYCSDCEVKRNEIEESGVFVVVSCTPLPDQNGTPDEEKKCEIKWRIAD